MELKELMNKKENFSDAEYTYLEGCLNSVQTPNETKRPVLGIKEFTWLKKTLNARRRDIDTKNLEERSRIAEIDSKYHEEKYFKEIKAWEDDDIDTVNFTENIKSKLSKNWEYTMERARRNVMTRNLKATDTKGLSLVSKFQMSYPYYWDAEIDKQDEIHKEIENLYTLGQEEGNEELLELYISLKEKSPDLIFDMLNRDYKNYATYLYYGGKN